MMRLELKSIGYWSLIKISFVVNLVIGFVIGLVYAIFMGAFLGLAGNMSDLTGMPMMDEAMPPFGILMVIMPLFFAFFGAVFNTILFLITAFVYNLTARLAGGLEFNLEEIKQEPTGYVPPPGYTQPVTQPPPPPPPPPPVEPLPPDVPPPSNDTDDDKV